MAFLPKRQISPARSSITMNIAGTNTSDRTVENNRPPITASAIGERNSPPAPNASALGLMPLLAGTHRLDCEFDQHDGVLGDDTQQHQDADVDWNGELLAGEQERENRAADRERQREQNGERLQECAEQQH